MIMTISKDDYDYMNAYTKAVEVIKKHNFEADNAVEYVETLAALEAIKVGLDEMAKTIQYSEDCVSRDAALALSEWYGESATHDNPFPDGAEAVPVYKIEQLPTVQPTRPIGKWKELEKIISPNELICECSVCGHVLSFLNYYPKSNYCPKCGAKMTEGEEKNDK